MKVSPDLYHIKIESTNAWGYGDGKLEQFNKSFNTIKAKLEKVPMFADKILPYPNPEDVNYSFDLIDKEAMVLSKDQLIELMVANLKFEVLQDIKIDVDITQQLIDLAEKPIKIAMAAGGDNSNTYNNSCEVHMPGNMMAMYNEVCILDDACSDVLQSNLNAGWRIIAACPQPDQRRPDYVLGRFNPNLEANASASRGEH